MMITLTHQRGQRGIVRRRRSLQLGRTSLAAASVLLVLTGLMTTPARAEPVTPPSSPAAADPAEPTDQVPPAKRDKVLPKNWRSSKDRIWTTTGDANGFHVL